MLHYVCRKMVRRSAAGFAQAPRGSERPLQCPPLCRHIRHVREGMLLPHHQLQAQGGHLALARVCTAHHEIMTLINRVLVKMPGIKWVLMGRTDPRERKKSNRGAPHSSPPREASAARDRDSEVGTSKRSSSRHVEENCTDNPPAPKHGHAGVKALAAAEVKALIEQMEREVLESQNEPPPETVEPLPAPPSDPVDGKLLLEELEREKKMWEEKTRTFLESVAHRAPQTPSKSSNPVDPPKPSAYDPASSGTEWSPECTSVISDPSNDAHQRATQVAVMGTEPSIEAPVDALRPGSSASSAASSGRHHWMASPQQWAAQKLRRKRERGLCSNATTPCSSPSAHPSVFSAPLQASSLDKVELSASA